MGFLPRSILHMETVRHRQTDAEALTSCDLQQVVDANLVKPLEASWIWIQREQRDPFGTSSPWV